MNLAHLSPMSADEMAALLFICGDQYLFRYRTNASRNGVVYKFVSSAAVRAAFAEETIETNWLPMNARRWGIGKRGEWIVITFPPQKHRFSFVTENKETGTMTLELPMPALAFFGYDQRYYVWAFTDAELKGETNLFAAPLPNVDANGAICFGSNLVPKASARTIEEAWRIFLASLFTNHSVNGKSRKHPDDVRKQLLRLAETKRRRYPSDDLVSLNRTANMVIEWMVKGIE
jgi:PRTRC genetic system protein B